MSLKEDVLEMKNEVEEIREQSLALLVLQDYKKNNKRLFIVLITVLFMWFATIGYLIYILNDIGTIEATQEISNIDKINGSIVNNGDIYDND